MDMHQAPTRLKIALTCAALCSLATSYVAGAQSAPTSSAATSLSGSAPGGSSTPATSSAPASTTGNTTSTPASIGPLSAGPTVALVGPASEGVAGNITLHGVAVDCATGQPAARVAVYDGVSDSAPYVADAAIDTVTNLDAVCAGKSGSAPGGFTLIYDTHNLNDGEHTLAFVAEYPDGTSAVTVEQVFVDNFPQHENDMDSGD